MIEVLVGGGLTIVGGVVAAGFQMWRDGIARRKQRRIELLDAQRSRAIEMSAAGDEWEVALEMFIDDFSWHVDIPTYSGSDRIISRYDAVAVQYRSAVAGVNLVFDDPDVLRAAVAIRQRVHQVEKLRDLLGTPELDEVDGEPDIVGTLREELALHREEFATFERAVRERLVDVADSSKAVPSSKPVAGLPGGGERE